MNSKIVSIIALTIALASLSIVGISTSMPYIMASQDDSYKNQGQCMKGEKEDGVDKDTFKMSCKAINFNDDEGYDNGGSNDDDQDCQTCPGN